jgi:hypothetical protein
MSTELGLSERAALFLSLAVFVVCLWYARLDFRLILKYGYDTNLLNWS